MRCERSDIDSSCIFVCCFTFTSLNKMNDYNLKTEWEVIRKYMKCVKKLLARTGFEPVFDFDLV